MPMDRIPRSTFDSLSTASQMAALFAAGADKTVANTAVETSVFDAGAGVGSLALPAGFWKRGRALFYKGFVSFGTAAVLPSLTVSFWLNSTKVGEATAGNIVANANDSDGDINGMIVCRAEGASGSVKNTGVMNYSIGNNRYFDRIRQLTAVDLSGPTTLDIRAKWNTASAQNTITIENAAIWWQ